MGKGSSTLIFVPLKCFIAIYRCLSLNILFHDQQFLYVIVSVLYNKGFSCIPFIFLQSYSGYFDV